MCSRLLTSGLLTMIDKAMFLSMMRHSATELALSQNDSFIEELNLIGGLTDEKVNLNSKVFRDFDYFGFAWDRVARGIRVQFLALAYRENNHLFSGVNPDSPLSWDDFSLQQRAAILAICDDMLLSVVSLFVEKIAAHQHISGYRTYLEDKAQAETWAYLQQHKKGMAL